MSCASKVVLPASNCLTMPMRLDRTWREAGARVREHRPPRLRRPFSDHQPTRQCAILLTLTRRCTDEERHVLAWRVAMNGSLLLLGSLLIGSHILTFFGLTLPIIRI